MTTPKARKPVPLSPQTPPPRRWLAWCDTEPRRRVCIYHAFEGKELDALMEWLRRAEAWVREGKK